LPEQIRIFISVAEDSADLHAAALVRAARAHLPDCRFFGLTGPRLRAAGVDTVFDMTANAAMLGGTLSRVPAGRRALQAAEAAWKKHRPALVIVMDSSALHLPMAARARRLGLRVLYYIAPQVWASRAYRNRQLAENVDHVACILPFEQAYFRRHLVLATYVGHPLFETLRAEQPRQAVVDRLRAGGKPVIAVLPGSRQQVIDRMLPRQLEVVRRLRSDGTVVEPFVSAVAADRIPLIRRHIYASGHRAEVITDDNASLLSAADLVLVASGTATLHAAYYRKPMIVMYHAGGRMLRWGYQLLGRRVITTPHLSLVNILAGARVVPEFMPFVEDQAEVARLARQLLTDETWRAVMIRQLDEVVRLLETACASEHVCALIRRLIAP
jgi:lipid-A-disaccharide synthase